MNEGTLAAGTRPARAPGTDAAWHELLRRASAPYRGAGRFAWHFARGKLGRDPVFRSLVERGEWGHAARVVDIGCGQGLLASLLHACGTLHQAGQWPGGWAAPPALQQYTGVELMPRDVARAERALAPLALPACFVAADMRAAALPACDLVVILDVLHYVDHADQAALLARVRDALQPHGRLLLRIGDQAQRRGYTISQWVDRIVTGVRGHRVPPTWGRTRDDWVALLGSLGFTVRSAPMSAGTPFANVLLVADLHASLS